ncbi:MAG: deoxynucleoside kinase [Bacilli bacterium]|jgi:deoxyadenosine/deoxycytidine kinase|nr:deoxynucleoside kinase [Bacilli bacterium]MDD3389260.1 deoxynucleoside kinase [Bacilli bacterium]MDD4344943.1 deoxynucleoside kinase [Bacilli bacterium]MDD4520752.1 deoxynucleoside kinase [Bacilli bacterium]MDY0399474.1 deoxynucleoside kinase [Bacilli bacterium]
MRIGVIGPIGAGKSLLASKLAAYFHAQLVEEPVATSPFLAIYYQNIKEVSFVAQNFFYGELFLRLHAEENNQNVITDSTLFSNLVFAEILQLQGLMNAHQVALTYEICDLCRHHVQPLDLEIVIVRSKAQLFKNVYRRSRDVEKGQEDYLNFHYQHYYALLDKIYSHYHLPKSKILYLDPGDMNDPAQWKIIIEQIEEAYQKNNAVITK